MIYVFRFLIAQTKTLRCRRNKFTCSSIKLKQKQKKDYFDCGKKKSSLVHQKNKLISQTILRYMLPNCLPTDIFLWSLCLVFAHIRTFPLHPFHWTAPHISCLSLNDWSRTSVIHTCFPLARDIPAFTPNTTLPSISSPLTFYMTNNMGLNNN